MTPKKYVSLQRIAEECGVSRMAVSIALNPQVKYQGRLSDETKAMIQGAAKRLGYKRDEKLAEVMAFLLSRRVTSKPTADLPKP